MKYLFNEIKLKQVYKIRGRLNNMGHTQIEIGSTEAFQGREKRVIIISTVRAKDNLLLYDKKYKLGFVEDPRVSLRILLFD